jgi:hypothetical protein
MQSLAQLGKDCKLSMPLMEKVVLEKILSFNCDFKRMLKERYKKLEDASDGELDMQ